MARITIEDCLPWINDPFELAVLAAHRARQISRGAPLTINRNNDKDHILALREIAKGVISPQELEQDLLRRFQRYIETEEEPDGFTGPSDV